MRYHDPFARCWCGKSYLPRDYWDFQCLRCWTFALSHIIIC